MKITGLVEQIFAQAVALDQSAGLRNTIYAINNEIYILNYDHTVLLRFRLRNSEALFDPPISFRANDYDSNNFEEQEGRIIFTTIKGDYQRKKICGTSDLTCEEVKELYARYVTPTDEKRQEVILTREALELLDSDLSHVEFSGKAGQSLRMVQRNIYSGGIIEVEKLNDGLYQDLLTEDFGPVGIKTEDFRALFAFQDSLKFQFPSKEKEDFIFIRSIDANVRNMVGVIACCLYDELIKIKEAKNGGQE